MRLFLKILALMALPLMLAGAAQAELRLLMFDSIGCPYCERWKEEVGVIYPKTPEGRQVPLTIIDIDDPLPEGVTVKSDPVYTPTFVVLRDNAEFGRIEGYLGEDFFWGMLEMILEKAQTAKSGS